MPCAVVKLKEKLIKLDDQAVLLGTRPGPRRQAIVESRKVFFVEVEDVSTVMGCWACTSELE